jgi:putative membrane protein insertion efficiency factor
MPPLRQGLTIFLAGVALVVLTTFGPPEKQPAARLAVFAIRGYQHLLSPVVRRYVRCRYVPSCSEYAAEAIHNVGFWPGALLGVRRIASCRKEVPLGTHDPPPAGRTAGALRAIESRPARGSSLSISRNASKGARTFASLSK